jgi:hypothetical protein
MVKTKEPTGEKAPPINRTIIIWNDRELVVRQVSQHAVDDLVSEIRRRLHGDAESDDPRWQVQDGKLLINVWES